MVCGISLNSCKKDNPTDDPNAGKVDPSTIATANLVAYFPFESETGSITKGDGITFSKTGQGATFATGRRGNAYKGNASGSYLVYNVAANNPFKTMKAFTLAAWIKTPPAIVDGNNGAAMIFQLNGGDPFMGNLDFVLEGNSNQDSLDIKGYLYNSTTNWKGQDIRLQKPAFLVDKWVHIAFSYDNATSTMALWANGALVGTSVRYADGADPVTGNQPLLGDLTLNPDMSEIHIGAWAQQIADAGESWMRYFPGMLDELRIYNKALSAEEMKSLYDAEVTQLNP